MEAMEAVEAVAVDEGLLEEDTGVVGRVTAAPAWTTAASIQWNLSQLWKDGSQAASVHQTQGVGQPRDDGRRQGKQCFGQS